MIQVPVIEVTPRRRSRRLSFNYGFPKPLEQQLIKAAAETAKRAKIAFLMLPGLGTKDDIRAASGQRRTDLPHRHPLHRGRRLDPALRAGPRAGPGDRRVPDDEPSQPPEVIAKQAASWPTPAASACTSSTRPVRWCSRTFYRVRALRAELGDDAQIGFHGHENLDIAVANSVNAVRAGASRSTGPSAGSVRVGNTPTEAFVGVCDKLGITTGIDFMKIADAAQTVRPAMPSECLVDRSAMMMGYAGCLPSFLSTPRITLNATASRRGDPAGGRCPQARRRPGDQLIDIALELRKKQDANAGV